MRYLSVLLAVLIMVLPLTACRSDESAAFGSGTPSDDISSLPDTVDSGTTTTQKDTTTMKKDSTTSRPPLSTTKPKTTTTTTTTTKPKLTLPMTATVSE